MDERGQRGAMSVDRPTQSSYVYKSSPARTSSPKKLPVQLSPASGLSLSKAAASPELLAASLVELLGDNNKAMKLLSGAVQIVRTNLQKEWISTATADKFTPAASPRSNTPKETETRVEKRQPPAPTDIETGLVKAQLPPGPANGFELVKSGATAGTASQMIVEPLESGNKKLLFLTHVQASEMAASPFR